MSLVEALLVLVAGVWAGAINTLVGSGSLVTFPVLLAVGYPPLTANISNSLGVVPGSVTGAYGYRRELRGQGGRLLRFAPASALGAIIGAVLLLALPASAFDAIVPVFVAAGVLLVVLQPRINRRLARRRATGAHTQGGVPALAATGLTGVYGGYFGAAQGVLLIAILGLAIDDDLQRVNAVKVVLAGLVNLVGSIVFVIAAQDRLSWDAIALIAAGSAVGGQLGARIGRRLPAPALRAVIVVVGLAAIGKLLAV